MRPDRGVTTALFATGVISVCQPERPFWRAGGRLCALKVKILASLGAESVQSSSSALSETMMGSPLLMTRAFESFCDGAAAASPHYSALIDSAVAFAEDELLRSGADAIASTPRNGWIISVPVAVRLGLPHIMIFDDKRIVEYRDGRSSTPEDISGRKVIIITDVIGSGNTFRELWVPALTEKGASVEYAFGVIDRLMGGSERLTAEGVSCASLCVLDEELFSTAGAMGLISPEQASFVNRYITDPVGSMCDFVAENPDYISYCIENGDPADRAAARTCFEQGFYVKR